MSDTTEFLPWTAEVHSILVQSSGKVMRWVIILTLCRLVHQVHLKKAPRTVDPHGMLQRLYCFRLKGATAAPKTITKIRIHRNKEAVSLNRINIVI